MSKSLTRAALGLVGLAVVATAGLSPHTAFARGGGSDAYFEKQYRKLAAQHEDSKKGIAAQHRGVTMGTAAAGSADVDTPSSFFRTERGRLLGVHGQDDLQHSRGR